MKLCKIKKAVAAGRIEWVPGQRIGRSFPPGIFYEWSGIPNIRRVRRWLRRHPSQAREILLRYDWVEPMQERPSARDPAFLRMAKRLGYRWPEGDRRNKRLDALQL